MLGRSGNDCVSFALIGRTQREAIRFGSNALLHGRAGSRITTSSRHLRSSRYSQTVSSLECGLGSRTDDHAEGCERQSKGGKRAHCQRHAVCV